MENLKDNYLGIGGKAVSIATWRRQKEMIDAGKAYVAEEI